MDPRLVPWAAWVETVRHGYHIGMSKHDDAADRAARHGHVLMATLLSGVLLALPLAAGCGDDTAATASSSPGAQATTSAAPANADLGPPKSPGGVCERATVDRKSLPELARVTVERFIAAADQADRETMRALLDPSGADEVLADLRPVTRLGLLALEDRY
jgi:hypothetical protein